MYRQKLRGSPTGKSPAALCCTAELSQMSTSCGRHACAYARRALLGVILQRLQQRAAFRLRHPFDVGRPVEIEVERGIARDGMRADDGMPHVDELLERPFGRNTRREGALVVVCVHRA